MAAIKPVIAYKAFNADMTCRDFQYKVGETYTHSGKVSLCNEGFHACTLPFDCWNYYSGSMTFARVKMEGVSEQREDDSKIVAASITIEARLDLSAWIREQVGAVIELCKGAKDAFSTKDRTNAATTGEGANAATMGYRANAATTGYRANAATTGEGANAATTGYRANAATTGEGANAATTGEGANAATTGYRANAATTGKNAVASATGQNCKAKAGENGCIVLAWFDRKAERPRVSVGYVGEGIKADVWYSVDDSGKFVEEA